MRKQSLVLVAVILLLTPVASAQHPVAGEAPPMQMKMGPGHAAEMDCEAMMKKMQGSSAEMDDRLQSLLDDMNKAKGSAKVDRMAAVLVEMAAQRKQMREQMAAMMPQMMEHMMQHMQSGMMSGMSHSMSSCPMMKGGAGMEKPEAEHTH